MNGSWCEGHAEGEVLADIVMHQYWIGMKARTAQYDLCIECAEAIQDTIDEADPAVVARLRDYWWALHANTRRAWGR